MSDLKAMDVLLLGIVFLKEILRYNASNASNAAWKSKTVFSLWCAHLLVHITCTFFFLLLISRRQEEHGILQSPQNCSNTEITHCFYAIISRNTHCALNKGIGQEKAFYSLIKMLIYSVHFLLRPYYFILRCTQDM